MNIQAYTRTHKQGVDTKAHVSFHTCIIFVTHVHIYASGVLDCAQVFMIFFGWFIIIFEQNSWKELIVTLKSNWLSFKARIRDQQQQHH